MTETTTSPSGKGKRNLIRPLLLVVVVVGLLVIAHVFGLGERL